MKIVIENGDQRLTILALKEEYRLLVEDTPTMEILGLSLTKDEVILVLLCQVDEEMDTLVGWNGVQVYEELEKKLVGVSGHLRPVP